MPCQSCAKPVEVTEPPKAGELHQQAQGNTADVKPAEMPPKPVDPPERKRLKVCYARWPAACKLLKKPAGRSPTGATNYSMQLAHLSLLRQ